MREHLEVAAEALPLGGVELNALLREYVGRGHEMPFGMRFEEGLDDLLVFCV